MEGPPLDFKRQKTNCFKSNTSKSTPLTREIFHPTSPLSSLNGYQEVPVIPPTSPHDRSFFFVKPSLFSFYISRILDSGDQLREETQQQEVFCHTTQFWPYWGTGPVLTMCLFSRVSTLIAVKASFVLDHHINPSFHGNKHAYFW